MHLIPFAVVFALTTNLVDLKQMSYSLDETRIESIQTTAETPLQKVLLESAQVIEEIIEESKTKLSPDIINRWRFTQATQLYSYKKVNEKPSRAHNELNNQIKFMNCLSIKAHHYFKKGIISEKTVQKCVALNKCLSHLSNDSTENYSMSARL